MVHELELRLTAGKMPNILVVGDLMVDKHVHCEVIGFSSEDDLTPKIRVMSEESRLGGAANVAMNLRRLGVDVLLVGQTGYDESSRWLVPQLTEHGIRYAGYTDYDRPTTVKTRYLTPRGRHIVRVDKERTDQSSEFLKWFVATIQTSWDVDLILVSDYAKGVVSSALMEHLRGKFQCPIVVDPKRPLGEYGHVFAMTPNHIEFEQYVAADNLCSYQWADWIVVTRGSGGCMLLNKNGLTGERFGTRAREMGDPTGCGDSFVAAFALACAKGFEVSEACRIGNAAGAVKYDHRGVYAVSVQEIVQELELSKEQRA